MRVISKGMPSPRLLSTVVPEQKPAAAESTGVRSRIKGVSLFSGNGRAIFMGMLLGAILLSLISVLYVRRQAVVRRADEARKLLAVSTHSISTHEPIVVKVSAGQIRVSAISLGSPRMAIINGHLVGEGDEITLHTPSVAVSLKLRVVKISDGNIELTDGSQVITARLEVAPPPKPKP